MQSSGTSTPAGDSPGPGRAFLRKADFTPEIAPPRLRRTTYPAGQSPLVLPGLTRASSSFTITSNHQNILPLWPAAPPPGQPVVFFILCPASVRAARLLPGGMVCPEGGGTGPSGACGPRCRTWGREEALPSLGSRSSVTRQPIGPASHGAPAGRKGWPSCAECPADTSSVRQALAGPVLLPCSSLYALAVIPALPGCHGRRLRCLPAGVPAPLPSHPSFLLRGRRALSACRAAGRRQAMAGSSVPPALRQKKDVHRHGDRRTSGVV